MSTRSCARYAHRKVPLSNFVACSPSRFGLFSIASASVALSFTLVVLTKLPRMSSRTSRNCGACSGPPRFSINSLLITQTDLCSSSSSLSKCSAAPIMPIRLVPAFFCAGLPKLSTWSSAAATTEASQWQNPLTYSELYTAGLLAPSSKLLLRRCSPHSFCHVLLASSASVHCLVEFARTHRVHTLYKCALDTSNTASTRFRPRRSARSVITWLTNAFRLSTGGIAVNTSLGSSFSSSVLALLTSLTTSRALSDTLSFVLQNPFQRVRSALSLRTPTFRRVVKQFLLQHPIDFLLFPFLDFDRVEQISLLVVVVFLPLFRVQVPPSAD